MPRAWIVVNPIAGSPRRKRVLDTFRRTLESEGCSAEVHHTAAAGDGARIAAEAAHAGVDLVVAAGGDGTVNDVARGLPARATEGAGAKACALAVLPLGTSNLVARHLGIPLRSPEAAARGLGARRHVAVDVGEANGRPWLACAGVGLDARIVAEVTRSRTGHIGFASYAGPTWRVLRDGSPPRLRVLTEGHPDIEAHLVLALNARPYSAFLAPAPDASMTDGLLDFVALRGHSLLRLARWGWRAWRGTLTRDADATLLRATRVRVESAVPVPFQIDGDVGATTPVEFRVRPAALTIALPDAARTADAARAADSASQFPS